MLGSRPPRLVLSSALLHLLFLWLMLLSDPVTVATPQGAAAAAPGQFSTRRQAGALKYQEGTQP